MWLGKVSTLFRITGLVKKKKKKHQEPLSEKNVRVAWCSHPCVDGQFRSITISYETLFVGNKDHLKRKKNRFTAYRMYLSTS